MFGILILVVALIVYGSLYPGTFEAKQLPASPLYLLLHSWDWNWNRRFLFDVIVNVAIYVPLGASAHLAFRRSRSRIEILLPILLGTVLSASMEMAQLFTANRVCSTVDFVDNVLGSALGVAGALIFTRFLKVPIAPTGFQIRDRGAVALLVCWIGSLLFPLFPVSSLAGWETKLSTFVHGSLDPLLIVLSAAEWLAVGHLLSLAGVRWAMRWLVAMLVLLPVQFGIVNRNPSPAEIVGGVSGAILFYAYRQAPRAAGVFLLIGLTLRGLAPFHLENLDKHFSWIPFVGFLSFPRQDAIPILCSKIFQYGASLCLLRNSGFGIVRTSVMVILLLIGIEVLQVWIPGHVSEITDPLLAVMISLGLIALNAQDRHSGNQ